MRALMYDRYGNESVLQLRDLPAPAPAPDEVQVRVSVARTIPLEDVAAAQRDMADGKVYGKLCVRVAP